MIMLGYILEYIYNYDNVGIYSKPCLLDKTFCLSSKHSLNKTATIPFGYLFP